MHVSRFIPAAAGLLSLANANLLDVGADIKGLTGGSKDSSKGSSSPAVFDLAHSWDDHTLFNGVCGAKTDKSPAVTLGLSLPEAQISGSISLDAGHSFLTEPTIKIGLGGVKAYVELDVTASAGVQESIELFASPALCIDVLDILDAKLGAAFALDLVLGVDAAIDVTAGFYLAFDDSAFVEVSLLTKDIVDTSLTGLTAHALPIGLGVGVDLSAEIKLEIGLRLRTLVSVSADVNVVGLDIIGADAVVAIWVNLFDYTAVLVNTGDCLLSVKEEFALAVGIAVKLDVEVLDILDLSLAPTVFVTLGKTELDVLCLDHVPHRPQHSHTASATISATDSATVSATDSATISATTSGAPSATWSASKNSTASITTSAPGGLVTSTTSVTHTYTITSCAASVKNCPARYTQHVVTSTIVQETTVCPATMTGWAPTTTTKAPVPVKTITETLTTIVPCKTRSSSTFTPPTVAPPAPTVTIDESTTICPVTATETAGSTGAASTVPSSVPAWTTPAAGASTPAAGASTTAAGASTTAVSAVTSTVPVIPGGPIVSSPAGGSNNTWTSVVVPPTGSVMPPPPASTPTSPVVGGAAALKAGMVALAMPAMLMALL